jgi:iron complex transport system ATP-binding protein
MPVPALLCARSIAVYYARVAVLRGVSLELAAGRVHLLLGPNGSGKSTLLKTIMGQIQPSGGSISWLGRDVGSYTPRELARLVAFLPQNPSTDPWHTVRQSIRLGRAPYWGLFGVSSQGDELAVRRAVSQMDLTDLMDRRVDQLSGGQRQRLFLARCLAQEPQALVLDEPTTFLDLRHQIDLLRQLQCLAREKAMAILLTSHEVNLALSFADEVTVLKDGAALGTSSPAQLLQNRTLEQAYEVPLEVVAGRDGRTHVVPVP